MFILWIRIRETSIFKFKFQTPLLLEWHTFGPTVFNSWHSGQGPDWYSISVSSILPIVNSFYFFRQDVMSQLSIQVSCEPPDINIDQLLIRTNADKGQLLTKIEMIEVSNWPMLICDRKNIWPILSIDSFWHIFDLCWQSTYINNWSLLKADGVQLRAYLYI